jgi:dTDP-4-dehydrorhamnose reductase
MTTSSLQLWGGLECTVARIGEVWRDQVRETGHDRRLDDLDRVAALGIKTLRYPALWERIAPAESKSRDFAWQDLRMARLKALGIAPILGLVHHGSGPRYTDFLDPEFPAGLAAHAGAVAARYPWVEAFTPVNEPLTTARFSGLYGHWHPHGADERTFLRCLLAQCRAILASMRAIRTITPHARLVQTDDLGKTFSTPALRRQADYENERRWLGFDLLCGRVDAIHPFYEALKAAGASPGDFADFASGEARPDIIGVNHYLTSERFLDENLARYPARHHGGNGRETYADVEAVRVEALRGLVGPQARLREAWERYALPLAVTEVHHGSSRDEQVRWLCEVWRACLALRHEGVDVRAATVWSLFGAMDWNSLLVRSDGVYEPGAFDARSDPPRSTALARAAAAFAKGSAFDHPVLDRPGWWRRSEHCYGGAPAPRAAPARPILVAGTGTLGRAFARICAHRGLDHVLLARADLDIAEPAQARRALRDIRPWAVVNAAGYVRVAQAESEEAQCLRENAAGAAVLAAAAAEAGARHLAFSSDLVFDGALGRTYLETDTPCPDCVYGRAKETGERLAAQAAPEALIVRTAAFFGPWDEHNFLHVALGALARGAPFIASDKVCVTPTYVPDLVHAALDLLIDDERGLWHLANPDCLSWFEFAREGARAAGVDAGLLRPCAAGRARNTGLASIRGRLLPPLASALSRFVFERET